MDGAGPCLWGGGDTFSLRAVCTHVIADDSGHDGQADLLREAIDGTTGVNG